MELFIIPLILFFIIRTIIRKNKSTNMVLKPYRYNIQTRKSRHSWRLGF
jgi:hypothetical protein